MEKTEKIYLTEKWEVKNQEFRLSKFNTDILMRIFKLITEVEKTGEKCKIIFSINNSKIDSKPIVQKEL